jgi:putative FmdB family regulatory protein
VELMPKYEFMCESCKKNFEVVLTVAERATAKVACPTCGGGEVTPSMVILPRRPHERAEAHGRYALCS